MNALIRKEVHLLLPGLLTGLLTILAALLLLASSTPESTFAISLCMFLVLLCPAVVLITALGSFGNEFSLGTFSILLTQPVPRARIWWTKTLLSAATALLIWLGWYLCCYFIFVQEPSKAADFYGMFAITALIVLALFSSGLWAVLLIRHAAAAFWLAVLSTSAMIMVNAYLMNRWLSSNDFHLWVLGIPIGYSVAGFLFARCLFLRAQDVAWTGGKILVPAWPLPITRLKSSIEIRRRKPVDALVKKELQLQSVTLLGAAGLLALHLIVIALRRFKLGGVISEGIWMLWLVMPLLIGCAVIAEERKLGVAEAQFCLPVKRRTEFAIKGLLTLALGVFLGGLMPVLLETFASAVAAQSICFEPTLPQNMSIIAISLAMTLIGVFASSLSKTFLQSVGIAILSISGCILFTVFIPLVCTERITFFAFLDITRWNPALPMLIAASTIPIMLAWLAWTNFNCFHEGWRLWRRNILALAGTLVFFVTSSSAICNRAWEVFEKLEPPHGTAKLSLSSPPQFLVDAYSSFHIRLSDGRVWTDSLSYNYDWYEYNPTNRWKYLWHMFTSPPLKNSGQGQFMAGSDWTSVAIDYYETMGIRQDGTLWISEKAEPSSKSGAKMTRFGDGANWCQVARIDDLDYLLLKKDGTLWELWTNSWSHGRTSLPSVRALSPQQIFPYFYWKEIIYSYARKTDGSVWHVNRDVKTGTCKLERETRLDQAAFHTLSMQGKAYVGTNGTLWVGMAHWCQGGIYDTLGTYYTPEFLQVGKETDWVSVTISWDWMVALKSDGSLWEWRLFSEDAMKNSLIRLGIHNDWVAVGESYWGEVISLAADGSLWCWHDRDICRGLLRPSRKPELLANIFSPPK